MRAITLVAAAFLVSSGFIAGGAQAQVQPNAAQLAKDIQNKDPAVADAAVAKTHAKAAKKNAMIAKKAATTPKAKVAADRAAKSADVAARAADAATKEAKKP